MKAVSMYRPLNLSNALSDFDRYMESFFGDTTPLMGRNFTHLPAMDIREKDDCYILEMDLPGYNEKDIQINVDGGTLTIESKLEEENTRDANDEKKAKKEGIFLLRERQIVSFSRSFKLPENADPTSISASFKDGVLSLNMKKKAQAQKRLIQINK
ncbi:MAG: Hsp20/alpha crystallin family protein [Treponema sp.]|jgi:HSP20 family protein|nr:Hsp20/alpha crystallin family protein [Treponema sp.]